MLGNLKLKIFLGITLLIFPIFVSAANVGEKVNFFVELTYDLNSRSQITATLYKITPKIYFYIDDNWWNSLSFIEQQETNLNLENLGQEFTYKIYPILTSTFGSEPNPGIDNDERITVLIHPMKREAGGYFNSGNEYEKLQNPNSNEREMLYLNSNFINSPLAKSFLSHEFVHLITFNQKEKLFKQEEEVWLNEARAEYASTLVGYDSEYQGSNLQRRVNDFLKFPYDSITDWQGDASDYGVLNLFTQYLVDHYGIKILIDSLQSSKKGIESINYALLKSSFEEDFSQIFTDWTITVLVNNCNLGPKYCYHNQNLKGLRLVPSSNFLPLNSDSSLAVNYITKNWSAIWYKIFGGRENLTFEFDGLSNGNFKVPYLLCDSTGSCSINFLTLNQNQDGKIEIKDFNTKYVSLTIIPSVHNTNDISGNFSFSWQVQSKTDEAPSSSHSLNPSFSDIPSSFTFKKNLYFGISNSDVIYLKIILAAEGCVSGLANTEWFGPKTLAGVKCFQNKNRAEISAAAGYKISATGFVGTGTKAKLNQLLES
jgi:hypothetical protein